MPLPEMVKRDYAGVSPMSQGDFSALPKEQQDELIGAFKRELVFIQEDVQEAVDFVAAVLERANVLSLNVDTSRLQMALGLRQAPAAEKPDELEPSVEQ